MQEALPIALDYVNILIKGLENLLFQQFKQIKEILLNTLQLYMYL